MATTPLKTRAPANGRPQPSAPPRWKGDDAVPAGLAVTSAVILRAAIVVGGVLLIALGAARMMLVVLPVIIAVLLTTLLAPIVCFLRDRRGWRPAPAAFATTLLAVLVFSGLWALIIPGVISQSDELVSSVQSRVRCCSPSGPRRSC
jgi:predicted PurR-regulated permease PerM